MNFIDPLGLLRDVSRGNFGLGGHSFVAGPVPPVNFSNSIAQRFIAPSLNSLNSAANGLAGGVGAIGALADRYSGELQSAGQAFGPYSAAAGVVIGTIGRSVSATVNAANITFKTGHVAEHLKELGLSANTVEPVIAAEIRAIKQGGASTSSWWGRVPVEGNVVEYRAYTLPDGTINVGTYYKP